MRISSLAPIFGLLVGQAVAAPICPTCDPEIELTWEQAACLLDRIDLLKAASAAVDPVLINIADCEGKLPPADVEDKRVIVVPPPCKDGECPQLQWLVLSGEQLNCMTEPLRASVEATKESFVFDFEDQCPN